MHLKWRLHSITVSSDYLASFMPCLSPKSSEGPCNLCSTPRSVPRQDATCFDLGKDRGEADYREVAR